MDLAQFHRLRTAVQENASPCTRDDLYTAERSLRYLLLTSDLFDEIEVEHTADADRLVIALCKIRSHIAEADVARELEQLWTDRLSYPFWEAHALSVDDGHIEFEAASRSSNVGGYVTLHLVAQKVRVPAQRAPSVHIVRERASQ